MRRRFLFAVVAAVLCLLPLAAAAQDAAQKTHAVDQVREAEPARWNLALDNVTNLQDDLEPGHVIVEIVAHGPAIGMLELDAD